MQWIKSGQHIMQHQKVALLVGNSRCVQIEGLYPETLQLWVALHGRISPEVTCVEYRLAIWQNK